MPSQGKLQKLREFWTKIDFEKQDSNAQNQSSSFKCHQTLYDSLNYSIQETLNSMTITQQEYYNRQYAIAALQNRLQSLGHLVAYGSTATGILLRHSDIDVGFQFHSNSQQYHELQQYAAQQRQSNGINGLPQRSIVHSKRKKKAKQQQQQQLQQLQSPEIKALQEIKQQIIIPEHIMQRQLMAENYNPYHHQQQQYFAIDTYSIQFIQRTTIEIEII
jgi:hypothetical protein